MEQATQESGLIRLSQDLAAAVAQTSSAVVAVHGRHRFSSSGWQVQPGVIVTAAHTVQREDDLRVTLPDGRQVGAKLAGRDATTDLAVLRVEEANVSVLPRTEGTLQVGQLVLAVGRSRTSGVSASMGIVSSVGGAWRTWQGGLVDQLVRLDVTFTPGTSGSAVVDAQGRVLGLATAGLARHMGVAVPLATIDRVVQDLLTKGRVTRGYLGVGLQPVTLPGHLRSKLQLEQANGLIVLSVEREGPAEKAGVFVGDILVALNGRTVADTDDVQGALGPDAVGKPVTAQLVRGGEKTELSITVGERPGKE